MQETTTNLSTFQAKEKILHKTVCKRRAHQPSNLTQWGAEDGGTFKDKISQGFANQAMRQTTSKTLPIPI